MSKKSYDLVVIGGGSAGVRAARWAAAKGVKTLLIEKFKLGGTCVVRGCVPKKIMVMAAQFKEEQELQKNFGWNGDNFELSWSQLKQRRDEEVERLVSIYQSLLTNSQVEVVSGKAEFCGPHEVRVGEEEFSFTHAIIATGGSPDRLSVPGGDLASTSDDFFLWENRPERVCVVGGGYIALELAGVLNALGSETHIVCRAPQVLSGFDRRVRDLVQLEMQKKGVQFHPLSQIKRIEKDHQGLLCQLTEGSSLSVDQVLLAIGRSPQTKDLHLEKAGVEITEEGRVRVDEAFQTTQPSIFALGDVANSVNLTPVALHEAMWLVEFLYGEKKLRSPFSYASIPTAVFSQPEVATCGWTEEDVLAKNRSALVFESEFFSMKQVLGGRKEKSLIKMIVDEKTDQILGIHLVGAQSAEILQGFAVAVKLGLKKSDLDGVVGIHPTIAEELVTLRSSRRI